MITKVYIKSIDIIARNKAHIDYTICYKEDDVIQRYRTAKTVVKLYSILRFKTFFDQDARIKYIVDQLVLHDDKQKNIEQFYKQLEYKEFEV